MNDLQADRGGADLPISFTCPYCGLQSNVSGEHTGQRGRCTQCGATIPVPAAVSGPTVGVPTKRRKGPALVIVVAALVVVLAALLPPAIRAAREAARRAQCINQMKELGLAMHNYHDTYGSFPPAYLVDEDGKPMHSWRVLLLPWLQAKRLYDHYRFEEPWDSPHNMVIGNMLGGYFRCPSDSEGVNSETNYMMIVGPGTISDGTSVTRFREFADGSHHTILLVEVTNSGVHWLEPRDLDASQMSFEITPASGTEVGSCHPGIANVLMCDLSVRSVSDDTDPELIRAMSTIAGGEDTVPRGGGP